MSCEGWRWLAIAEGALLLTIATFALYCGAAILRAVFGGRMGPG